MLMKAVLLKSNCQELREGTAMKRKGPPKVTRDRPLDHVCFDAQAELT
jgi:hypothetical protein